MVINPHCKQEWLELQNWRVMLCHLCYNYWVLSPRISFRKDNTIPLPAFAVL